MAQVSLEEEKKNNKKRRRIGDKGKKKERF